jgi:hypothetical protein
MDSQENLNEIMIFFFTLQLSNKIYHLSTTLFARHKASDKFDDEFQTNIDKFTEVYIGRYNVKPQITKLNFDPKILTDDGIVRLFKDSRTYLENLERFVIDTDLLNIRDEMLAGINRTLYLFNLK